MAAKNLKKAEQALKDLQKAQRELKDALAAAKKAVDAEKGAVSGANAAAKAAYDDAKTALANADKAASELPQRFTSFDALKGGLGSPGEGKVWHHVVEQRGANVERFGAGEIHSSENVVAVSREANQAIADYYSSKLSFTGGKTVREWLSSQSFAEQMEFGRKTISLVLSGTPLPR